MKKILALIIALMCVFCAFMSCSDDTETTSSSESESASESQQQSSSVAQSSSSSSQFVEDTSKKYPEVPQIDINVNVDTVVGTDVFEDLSSFKNEGKLESYGGTIQTIDISKGENNIVAPGTYKLTGITTKGYVKIVIPRPDDTAPLEKVTLILDNVQITSSTDVSSIPPIYSKGCNLEIVIPKDTVNTITDTTTNQEKGAIYVKTGDLTISGEGTLKVNAVHKNAIFNTKKITVNGGIFDLTAKYHGIYGEGGVKSTVEDKPENHVGVVINTGDFKIKAEKSAIKSGDYEETNLPDQNVLGSITINGGKFDLETKGNAISCYGSVSINGGGYKIVSANDGINATADVIFDGENPTVMVIDAKDNGIKSDTDVNILGNTSIKILSIHDGIDANNIEIDTTGTLYIKTNASFIQDMANGEFILHNKSYHKVDKVAFEGKVFYAVDGSSKGIDAAQSLTIKNGKIGIDSNESALNGNSVTIDNGIIYLSSQESAVKATAEIKYNNGFVNVMRSYKGLNASDVTVKAGTLVLVAIADAIDAENTTVDGGTLYLYDKVDYPNDGSFVVTAGTVVCLSTTNNPKTPTASSNKYIAKSIESSAGYVSNSYVQIKGEGIDVTLKLPKKYSEKLSVVVVSPGVVTGTYTISVGQCTGGSISNLVYTGGTFTASSTESVVVE